MTNPKYLVRGVAIAVATAYTVALHLAGVELDSAMKKLLGYLPAILVALTVAFDLFVWRVATACRIVSRPRLQGTWLTTIQPRAGSAIPEGGNWGPIDAAVVIEQTFWSASVHLMTSESASSSTTASFRKRDSSRERQQLVFAYVNTPRQEHQPRSWPHAGACELEVVGNKPVSMNGMYWTGRLTVGDMKLLRLNGKTDYPDLEAVRIAAAAAKKAWP